MKIAAFFRILLRYLRPYWPYCLVLLLFLLIDVLFTTGWPLGFKLLIDTILPERNEQLLVLVLGALLIGALAAASASLGRDYLYAFLSSNVLHDVRLKVFVHLQRLSLDFYSRVGSGNIMSRFSSDLAAIETAIVLAMPSLILNSLILLIGAALLFALEWRLASLTVFGLIICIVAPGNFVRRAASLSYDAQQRQGALADAVHENVGAQPVVKALGLE